MRVKKILKILKKGERVHNPKYQKDNESKSNSLKTRGTLLGILGDDFENKKETFISTVKNG